MSTKSCDISDFIKNLTEQLNPDGTRKFTDDQIKGKLKVAYKKGYISRAQIIAASGKEDTLISETEFKELETLTDSLVSSNKPLFDVFSPEQAKRLLELTNKAKNSVGYGEEGRLNQSRLQEIINLASERTPETSISILTLVDESIQRAENNGDKKRAAELRDLKVRFQKMNDLSSKLKIDWNAIVKTNKQSDKLTAEYAIVRSILDVGDRETAEKRNVLSQKILALVDEQKTIIKDTTISEEEKIKPVAKLEAEKQNLVTQLEEITSKKFAVNRKKLEKRLKTITHELRRLQDNAPNSFLNKILVTVSGMDPEFVVTSLRELKERQLKVEDDIKLVEKVIEQYPTDKEFSFPELENLIGDDISTTKSIKSYFYEVDLDADGKPRLDSSLRPMKKRKEKITFSDMKAIVDIWKTIKRNNSYDSTITNVEANMIRNALLSGDQKLVSEVDPADPLPISRTAAERLTLKVGKQYDPRKLEDRVSAIKDLHVALKRLSYISSLANNSGVISSGMLVGVLGSNAQSLSHKFDSALADDSELSNPYIPEGETTNEGRRAVLRGQLTALGYSDSDINAMPEMRNEYHDDFTKIVGFDLEWEKGTNNIIAISIVELLNGESTPVNSRVIYSTAGKDKNFSKEDAEEFLQLIHRYQNEGFKVTGHNILGSDSDVQKLVSVSGNTKLGMSIALRSLDTMLLAFRNGDKTSFSRNFGPSLDNLAQAFKVGSKAGTGITGESAHGVWKSGDYSKFEEYIQGDSILAARILQEMSKNEGKDIKVMNSRKQEQTLHIHETVPIWYDTGKPEMGRNQRYTGVNVLYDIQSFNNLRENAQQTIYDNTLYDIAKVRNVITNMVLGLMHTNNAKDIDTLFSAINASETDALENIDMVMSISRVNHEAYLPILQQVRNNNGNRFLSNAAREENGDISYTYCDNGTDYENQVIEEMFNTLSAYNRKAEKTITRFAELVGFRVIGETENLIDFTKALFSFSAQKFNNKESIKIQDFGNGIFDYVSAVQLGRGFSQIMLGHVEEGLTLSQNIKTPVQEIDRIREVAKIDGEEIAGEDSRNLVEKREYLPITRQNVSYFAPLSMYEQERAYNDFALRERFHYILNKDITDDDVREFEKWVGTNRIVELKNNIKNRLRLHKLFREGLIKNFFDVKNFMDDLGIESFTGYDPISIILNKDLSKDEKVKLFYDGASFAKNELATYMKELDRTRLEQGRVQNYNILMIANNRDIYNRIPTLEEVKEMSLEVALDLPQMVATWVHDSHNTRPGERRHLEEKNYWEMSELSSGGPTGAALLSGIYPQIAWYMSHPEITSDPKAMEQLVYKSLQNGIAGGSKFSRSSYWDDVQSGHHHIVALQWAYFPDESHVQEGGLLQILDNIKTGNVGRSDLKDYYNETANEFAKALGELTNAAVYRGGSDSSTNPELAQIERINHALNRSNESREFFKGAVIPVFYSAGFNGVVKGLRDKKNKMPGDPISELSDEDIQFIAAKLTITGAIGTGRLIDTILGMDTEKSREIIKLFGEGTKRLTFDMRKRWIDIMNLDEDLKKNHITEDAARAGINLRLRMIAELTLPARYETTRFEREEWIKDRVKLLTEKWNKRIENGMEIIRKAGDKGVEVGSQSERDFHVALAGNESAFKTQMSLMAINQMQNSGLKLNSSDRDILEAAVRTGRYIAEGDLMYANHVVFTTVGFGSGSARAQYVSNYLTNLHGSRLSKGNRTVYNDDGSIDWDETIKNSAWSLEGNPLTGKPRDEAIAEIDKLAVKHYLLQVATDYAPTMIGYNQENESRSNFFNQWKNRTKQEREYDYMGRMNDVAKLKTLYETEDPTTKRTLTDAEIELSIASNSTPINKRIGTRILAGDFASPHDETVMSQSDAKGLAAFRPRLADDAFDDRIVHGLYSIYQGTKQLNLGVGRFRSAVQKLKEDNTTPESILDMENSRATQYDPEELGVYFPEIDSSLTQEIFGQRPTFNQKLNKMRFLLDTFGMQHGLQGLVKAKEYTRLYQIYKVRQAMKKFALLLGESKDSKWDMRFLHRHFIQQVFRITKAQRDASNSSRNLLNFCKSIGIDPSLFKDGFGNNLQWIDILGVCADMGIEELSTLKFGMSPVEMLTTSTTETPNILKSGSTIVMPNVIQGEDVSIIIQSIWADVRVQQKATEYADKLVSEGTLSSYEKDATGKYILLSAVPKDIQVQIAKTIFTDDELVMDVAENLGLHVTLEFVAGENMLRLKGSKLHASSFGAYVVPRRGLGFPSANRTVIGERDVKTYLTPEAVKSILYSAKNAKFFSRLETSLQVDKYLGETTIVDRLRQQQYGEYLDRHLEQIAEETELLDALEEGKLQKLRTERMRDELGVELNLYDAEAYFTSEDEITGLTPFKNAMSLDMRIAYERAKQYPLLQDEAKTLRKLTTKVENEKLFLQISFITFLRNNVSGKELTDPQLRMLVNEHFGSELTNSEFESLMKNANEITEIIDRINFSPFKGKNPYLAQAVKHRQMLLYDPDVLNVTSGRSGNDILNFMEEFDIPSKDYEIAAQAVIEAYAITNRSVGDVETYLTIPSSDLVNIASDPDEFARVFPSGSHINSQLSKLVKDGVIDGETELFYRLLISKILKHNPNLAKFLSIECDDLSTSRSAEAVKEDDRFIIKLNTKLLKNMGRIDQTRVFAHEISHIARLAFIADNGPEWRKVESLFRSKKGRDSIPTMLLIMNNNSKYEGFDQDVKYYTENVEEFLAQWGSWILLEKVFNNRAVMKEIQSRSTVALFASEAYKDSFYRMRDEVLSITTGLAEVDEGVLSSILDITESMFGFTSSVERTIHVTNANQKLGMISSFDTPLSNRGGEVDKLSSLQNKVNVSGLSSLTVIEQAEYKTLTNKYSVSPLMNLDIITYKNLRSTRESKQGTSLALPHVRSSSGKFLSTLDDLKTPEKLELANTVILESIKRGGKLARNLGTVGGLAREQSEKMFGKKATEMFLVSRYLLGTWDLTQASKTHQSHNIVVASLMHIIGETFNNTENQYQQQTGARSIRENRAYSEQWIDRVSYEVGQLRIQTTDDEFKTLLKYAQESTIGMGPVDPPGISAEKIDQAKKVGKTVLKNSRQLRYYIYGEHYKLFEEVPVQLDKSLFGSRQISSDPNKQLGFEKNRQDLIDATAKQIKENVEKLGLINGALFYVSGLGPKINRDYGYDDKTDSIDPEFLTEMKRVQKASPATFRMISEIAVRQLANRDNLTEAEAHRKLNQSTSDGSFLINGSPTMHKIWHESALKFYSLVSTYKHVTQVYDAISQLAKSKTFTVVSIKYLGEWSDEIEIAIKSNDEIRTAGPLFVPNGNQFLPDGVSSVTKKSTMLLTGQKQTKITDIMAGLFWSEMGEQPDYLRTNEIINGYQMRQNEDISKFLQNRMDSVLADVERSKGFRAASRIAIQDITGITGYDIYDLISLFKQISDNFEPKEKTELLDSLKVIEQKLQIEQGMSARGLNDEDDLYTNFFLKWGPDITRLAYGSNLNTASLVMEGALGALITTRYGGNPVIFFRDLFGSVFGNLPKALFGGSTYNPRGVAVNMMRGLEHSTRNAREVATQQTNYVSDGASRWERYRAMMSRVNNSIFNGVAEGMTNQAQNIIIDHLNNGNLFKIRDMLGKETLNNMDELKAALNKYNIIGILPHMVFELKQAGIFEPKILEAYQYMLNNVKSKKINNGTLDFNAANEWNETQKWNQITVNELGFDRNTAYRAVASMYEATKNFRNIVLVENNPWDSNTHSGGLRFLMSFYRQYPNLFFSQKVMRLGNKVDTGTFAAMLITTTILDLLYNALLLVALGSIPLAALYPLSDEFLFKKNPLAAARLILGRNPIFGLTGNLIFGAVTTGYQNYLSINNAYAKKNRYQALKKSIKMGIDQTDLSIVPQQAAETLIKDPITMIILGLIAGGNINEKETYDMQNAAINIGSRALPIFGEMAVRIGATRVLVGENPNLKKRDKVSPGIQPNTKPKGPIQGLQAPKISSASTNPLTPPDSLIT